MNWRMLGLAAITLSLGLLVPFTKAQQAPPPPDASRWPVQVETAAGQVTVFQPQLDDFTGDTIKARAAVSIQASGAQQPTYGCVWLNTRVATDRVARTVQILDVQITQSRFPNTDAATQQTLVAAVQQVFTGRNVTLSLDSLLAMVETIHKEQSAAAQLDSTPPKIIFLDHPAVKIQYDGAPSLSQADNSNLLRVVNTPFFVVLDPDTKQYYLKGAGLWFSAADAMGPFQAAATVPDPVSALATSSGYVDPQQPIDPAIAQGVQVVTATDPTELIWTSGAPKMTPISGTSLLYYSNTDSDVFLDIDNQQLYVLLSGRWYSAPNQAGPWAFVPPDQLPPTFAKIPADSDKSNVLAAVPNTSAAQDAVADTFIPQTAAIDMHNFDQPPVEYDGDPDFEPIEGTDMSYAVNTDASVILCAGQYYCCYNAVWYVSASPQGPWTICTRVPQEIYTIPPNCPIYPVSYCYVYGYTPDVCYVGYLPGYSGCYAYDGCVWFGTGYYYKPWLRHHYYPRPCTFGFSARYNWYTGHWGFDFAMGFGGGRAWIGRAPHGFVHNGGEWFGFGGFRPVYAHDAAHLTVAQRELAIDQTRRDAYVRNIYDQRKDVHREGIAPVRREPAPVEHPAAPAVRDDVFADRDGNVYRRTDTGWEARQENDWRPSEPAQRPEEAPRPVAPREEAPRQEPSREEPDLNREFQARQEGEQRAQSEPAPAPRAPEFNSGGAPDRGGGGGGGGGRGR
jgi:hypothetical protein